MDTKLYQSSGKYPYIRIKDLSDQSDINKFQTADVFISDTSNENISKYIVQKGSVLVALKGNKLKPTTYSSEEPAITERNNEHNSKIMNKLLRNILFLQLQQPYLRNSSTNKNMEHTFRTLLFRIS
ncbi:MAG: restriction endonuclease subunit S [Bacteroidetes bacterium]|nr:restriction endonuclease subunit S [Bacteroidota bacterium]